ncbi:MAG: MATE family efflux transporter [Stagnimonas sp.]|nr:MATE family efflux transporter [Stagnimonas sp.]
MLSAALRAELRANLRLAWPIIAAQLSFVSMGTVDTMLAGRLGASALAAVAVGANIFFLIFVMFMGLFMAVSPVVAQGLGAGRPARETGDFLRAALVLALWAGLLWALTIVLVGRPVLSLLELPAATSRDAWHYLLGIAPSSVAFCFCFVLRNSAEAHGLTRVPLYAGLVGLVVNGLVGWLLLFGKLGLPALGPMGTGIATSVAAWVMVLVYLAAYRRLPELRALRLWRPGAAANAAASRELIRIGLPIAAILTAEASLFLIGALLMARFGEDVVAAHQVAINFASVSFMVPLSVGLATTVRVGLAAGAGDAAAVALRGRAGMLLGIAFAAFSASLMALAPELIVGLYTDADSVRPLAVSFLAYAALFQIADCIQATANGALRGIKDTRLPMLITVTAYWVVGLPLAVGLAFHTAVGPAGVWWGFIAGLAVAASGLSVRFLRRTRARNPR